MAEDVRPGWYKQAESEFGDIFGPEADEQKAINDWAALQPDERDFYLGKLLYLNLRAQFHIVRTGMATLSVLRSAAAEAAEDEPAARRRRGGADEAPPADDGDQPPPKGRPAQAVTGIDQLPAEVQAAIRKHQRPADADEPVEVIERAARKQD